MKRLLMIAVAATLLITSAVGAYAAYDCEVNYLDIMIQAAVSGDNKAGSDAELSRNEKIDGLELDVPKISFEDVYYLSKIIYAEAGSVWLSDEWKMCVGEVVLNRVASSEFPDTVREVIEQEGQYYGRNNYYFNNLRPDKRSVELAVRLLEGERVMDEPSVVFQANFRQGSGVFLKLYDEQLGYTYLCLSSHPDLYKA